MKTMNSIRLPLPPHHSIHTLHYSFRLLVFFPREITDLAKCS